MGPQAMRSKDAAPEPAVPHSASQRDPEVPLDLESVSQEHQSPLQGFFAQKFMLPHFQFPL